MTLMKEIIHDFVIVFKVTDQPLKFSFEQAYFSTKRTTWAKKINKILPLLNA